MAPLFLVLYFLIQEGASSLDWNFFTQLPKPTGELGGGMANAIVGTLTLLAMAAAIGVPGRGAWAGSTWPNTARTGPTTGSASPPTS